MSVQDKINSLTASRNSIRNQLINFGLATTTDKLSTLATTIRGITNQGAKTGSVGIGGSYTIPAGYHNGSGKVSGPTATTKTVTLTSSQTGNSTHTINAAVSTLTVNASNVYNKGKQDGGGVAAVSLTTHSSQLYNKTITVKNSSNTTIATTTFNSSGKAFVTIPSAGVYTFTVTY